MKRSKFTDEQITFALRQAETGTRVAEVCRKMGIYEATSFNWKKKLGGLGVAEVRRLLAASGAWVLKGNGPGALQRPRP